MILFHFVSWQSIKSFCKIVVNDMYIYSCFCIPLDYSTVIQARMYLSTVFLHSKERRLPIRALKFCQSLIVRIDSYYEEVLKLFNAYPSCTRYALHVSCKQFYSIARLSHSFHISRSLVSMARKFKRALTCISFGHAGLYRQSGVQSSTKVTSTAKIACIR